MTNTVSAQLREGVTVLDEPFHHAALEAAMLEAADEIERLLGELERLRYHDRHTDRQADACDICEGVA